MLAYRIIGICARPLLCTLPCLVFSYLLLFSFPAAVYGSTSLFSKGVGYFETVGTRDDLPDMVISAIAQNRDGFLWLGTPQGLVRYDGYNFRKFTPPQKGGLGSIFSIWVAPDDNVWIATQSSGLYKFSPQDETFVQYLHDSNDENSLSGNYVRAIAGDADVGLWIGTSKGVDYLRFADERISQILPDTAHFAIPQNRRIHSLLTDKDNNLWVGTYNGLFQLNSKSLKWRAVLGQKEDPNDPLRIEFRSLYQAKNGYLWFGTGDKGAGWYDLLNDKAHWVSGKSPIQHDLTYTWVTDIAQPSDEEIWLATTSEGIYVVDAVTGKIVNQFLHYDGVQGSISANNIDSLFVDSSGLVWVGSWGGGLNHYNPNNTAIRTLRHHYQPTSVLRSGDINAVLELANGEVLIGTRGNGIDVFLPQQNTSEHFQPKNDKEYIFKDPNIMSLAQTNDGLVWVGTLQAGLFQYNISTEQVEHFGGRNGLLDDYVRSLSKSMDGGLWIGTDNGLNKWIPGLKTLKRFSHQGEGFNSPISKIVETTDGRAWVASYSGLFYAEPGANNLNRVIIEPDYESQSGAMLVAGLMVDSNNALWIGTTQGTYRLTRDSNDNFNIESVSQKVGLNGVSLGENLVEDGRGNIWTEDFRIDTEQWQTQSLGRAEGVVIGTKWWGSYTKLSNGAIVFGGSRGLLVIKPELFTPWTYNPPVKISNLLVRGRTRPGSNVTHLTLSPTDRGFSAEFTSLDFSAPLQNKYAYMLDGYDEEWIYTDAKNRIATYTNLDPGDYRLLVRGSNRLGHWSEQRVEIGVTQLPQWYQTWWFYSISLVFGLALIHITIAARTRHLNRRKLAMEKLVRVRTEQLEQKNVALRRAFHDLEQLSIRDQLTGLYNRHFVAKHLPDEESLLARDFYDDEQQKAASKNRDMGLLLLDIDHFKKINDVHGHDSGDKVLVQAAELLSKVNRTSDWVVRWGGEEFLIICRKTERQQLFLVAERIRASIAAYDFVINDNKTLSVTCSVGAVSFPFFVQEYGALSLQQTLQIADSALYYVKHHGRNGCAYIEVNTAAANTTPASNIYELTINNLQQSIDNGYIKLHSTTGQ